MSKTKQSLRQRFLSVFQPVESAEAKATRQLIKEALGQQRGLDTKDQNQFKEPKWDFELLDKWGTYSPALRTTHESIITECTRNGGKIKPRFQTRCPSCGTMFQTEKEKCPECDVATEKPDINQKQLLQAFIDEPNADNELIDIQKSTFRPYLRLSNAYISIQKANISKLQPVTVYAEDAVKMRIANRNRPEYFCPNCVATFPEMALKKDQPCPVCGETETKLTKYYKLDGKVTARWAKDEMCHINLDPQLPDEYGLSREISVLNSLSTLDAMDNLNLENYGEGKLANILVLEGMSQTEANKLASDAKAQQNKEQWDPKTGRYFIKKLKTLILGTGGKGGVTNVPAMPDSEKMQSLDWYKKYEAVIRGIYGVQDAYTGQIQEGSTGQNPRSKNDINNNQTEFYQHSWSDPFNNVIVKEALGVSDWVYEFNPIEEKDEAQDQAILASKLGNIKLAIELGMKAELTDEQEVKVSGQPETLEEKQKRAMETMQKQAELAPKDASPDTQTSAAPKDTAFEGKHAFKKENVFANEKASRKYLVIENPKVQQID